MADGMDMTYEELYSRISNGAYNVDWGAFPPVPNRLSANTIIDENQTVVWNRAQVDKHNEARAAIMQERRQAEIAMEAKFAADAKAFAAGALQMHCPKILSLVYDRAYEQGHSGGYAEVLSCLQDICSFVYDILDAMPRRWR